MTSVRLMPKPSATNFSSAARSCTNTTSASPRRPMSSACPVPTRDDAHLDAGRLLEGRQQVGEQARLLGARRRGHRDEAVLRDRGPRSASERGARRATSATSRARLRSRRGDHGNSPLRKAIGARRGRRGRRIPAVGRSASIAAVVHVDDRGRQALGLAEVVGAHHERRAVGGEGGEHALDLLLGRRVEARRRLVEEQHVGRERPGAREREALLLAARERPRRRVAQRPEADARAAPPRARSRARARGEPARAPARARRAGCCAGREAQQERPLEDHRLHAAPSCAGAARCAGVARRRRAGGAAGRLARAVGADDGDERRRRRLERRGATARTGAEGHRGLDAARRAARAAAAAVIVSALRTAAGRRRAQQRRSTTLSSATTASSTRPSASASGRSPLLVSSAMVVVMTRVTPSMLPPTIITAPTSATARPKATSSSVTTAQRSCSSISSAHSNGAGAQRAQLLAAVAQRVGDDLRAPARRRSAGPGSSARSTIAVGVKRMPSAPSGPLRDSSR